MPWRKRLLVALAAATGLALALSGALLVAAGRAAAGGLVLAATAALAALALQALWVRFDLGGASLRAGDPASGQVALTFDDGPGPDTPAVLDALDRAGARATFFVLGAAAEARPDLVREVARRGHLVALHGHGHRKLHLASPRAVAAEVDRGRAAVLDAGVEPAAFFRAPHGFKGPVLSRALRARGLTLVGWTRGVWDTERPGADAIADRATARLRGGEIVLLHDGCGTPGVDPRRDQTAAAIPEIVRRARLAGLEPVTLDRLRPRPRTRLRERAVRWGGLAVAVALAALAARRIDPPALGRALAAADPALLLAAAGANVISLAMQSGRWLAIARPVAPRGRPSGLMTLYVSLM